MMLYVHIIFNLRIGMNHNTQSFMIECNATSNLSSSRDFTLINKLQKLVHNYTFSG